KCKSRYIFAILGAFGMGIIYGLKVALHVVIVSMVNHTAVADLDKSSSNTSAVSLCSFDDEDAASAASEDGPFAWEKKVEGLLLSSYFWGYLIAQLPGGRIAELFSAKWVFFFAVAINVVCALLSPALSAVHWGGLMVLRILQGVGGGVTFPACHVLLAHWAPPTERSFMSSLVYAGTSLGTVIFMLLSGVISGTLNWQAVFYIEGGVSALWLFLWVWLVADTPQKQRLISAEERDFIMTSLGGDTNSSKQVRLNPHLAPSNPAGLQKHPPIPWRAVFTSKAFLAILIAHVCSNWGWYLLLIELPQYMKDVLRFKIEANGLLSALPFFVMWIFTMILSKTLDFLMGRGKINTTVARKIATLIASVVPMVCLLVLCFVECNRALAVAMMVVGIMCIGGMFCGFLSNHIDIAPNYAGTLMAITNTAATVPGIVVPIVTAALTESDPSIKSWSVIFYITIGLYAIEILVYTVFGSGEVQKWNYIELPSEDQPLRPK
ncbi:sialin, partial [Asbolus verrucosus]